MHTMVATVAMVAPAYSVILAVACESARRTLALEPHNALVRSLVPLVP